MIIKIDQELCPEKILKVVHDLLKRNHPIEENKVLSITIASIVESTIQETKRIDVK
jgi:hypothetical protein